MNSDETKRKLKGKKKLQQKVGVSDRIRDARKKHYMTQQDVADELGITPQAVSYIENHPQGLVIDYLILLRKSGCDLNKLFEQ